MATQMKNYLQDKRGNIAVIFGLCATFLVLVVGAAYDLTTKVSAKKSTQALADMAVLAAAQSGLEEQSDLQTLAESVVAVNGKSGIDYTTVVSISPENYIQVAVSRIHENEFMGGFGHNNDMITTIAQAPPRGDGKLNLALVLDVTKSMEGAKLTALQDAAEDLIEAFDNDDPAASDNVMMSVVPFARYVKIPITNLGQPWLEVEPTAVHTWNHDLNGCGDNDDDGVIDDPSCVPNYEERSATIAWSGCMGSRQAPWHVRDYYVPGKKLQGFAGGGSCYSELLPLTSDLDAVQTRVDSLTAEDQTFIPAGLMWGWRTLTPDAPFTEANTADFTERKNALLLMTDGNNTRSYGGTNDTFNGVFHWNSDQADADQMTADICTSIKDDGIIIYTVAFEVSDAATHTLLRNCETEPANYFNAGNAAQLASAFSQIGKELAEVRLSR